MEENLSPAAEIALVILSISFVKTLMSSKLPVKRSSSLGACQTLTMKRWMSQAAFANSAAKETTAAAALNPFMLVDKTLTTFAILSYVQKMSSNTSKTRSLKRENSRRTYRK